jgi:thiol-disulfide isomerase/thioredoxin
VASFPGLTRKPQEFQAFLDQAGPARPAVPATESTQTAPPATGPLSGLGIKTLEGGNFDPAPLQGKVVVLNFWATWCVPCIREIPNFNRFSREWSAKGVEVIGVSLDEEGATVVRPFLKEHPIQYRLAIGSEAAGERFQATPLPTTVVLDRNGKTLQRFQGFTRPEAIEAAVRHAL